MSQRLSLFIFLSLLTVFHYPLVAQPDDACQRALEVDPFWWLEEVESDLSMQWVKEQNDKASLLKKNPLYEDLHGQILAILNSPTRVPFGGMSDGYFWNFWQDENHKLGVLRRTTHAEYLKEQPNWEVVLDLDSLAKVEKENWAFKGSLRLGVGSSRRLVILSRGGQDASVMREYDVERKQFVTDGFRLPEARTKIAVVDENTLYVATNWGPGSLTESGYPRHIKMWRRGEDLTANPILFSVNKEDVSANIHVLRATGKTRIVFERTVDRFHSQYFLYSETGLRRLPIPEDGHLEGIDESWLYMRLRKGIDVAEKSIPGDSVLRVSLEDDDLQRAETIFTAGPRQAISHVTVASDRVFVDILDNITSQILEFRWNAAGERTQRKLDFPANGVLTYHHHDEEDPSSIDTLSFTSHLQPTTQYRVHEDGRLEVMKSQKPQFDTNAFEVEQLHATSRDGTHIPYFVVKAKGLKLDGRNPTLLYGYGGFESSMLPSFVGNIRGTSWLTLGGVYVEAAIRGGGEFGSSWHQDAIRAKRQNAFDDFAAVADDLSARRITSPRHLGVSGGSNGGLLTGVTLTQRPDLINAAVIDVPLLDMLRFHKLLAGHSWIGEYGDPDKESDRDYLARYSPYHNVRPDRYYPPPLLMTSTKDDRVHPAHARKMAARMHEQGHPLYFYEIPNGGHTGNSTNDDTATLSALEYTYLWTRLK